MDYVGEAGLSSQYCLFFLFLLGLHQLPIELRIRIFVAE